MNSKIHFPIKYVAQVTGLKPYLIRTWEVRYSAVCPRRTPTNRRIFTEREIHRLKLLQRAVASGHTISSVAALSDEELAALVASTPSAASSPASEDAAETPPADRQTAYPHAAYCEKMVGKALTHVVELDAEGLDRVLTSAAVELPRQAYLEEVVVPLFAQIGGLWKAGQLKVVNEHMASNLVRSHLWDMLRTAKVAETAPAALVATPAGHWHEYGALASALAAVESGWRALYFGPSLPAEEIAFVVKRMKARVLILSLGHRLNNDDFTAELRMIRRLVGDQLPILAGGTGVFEGADVLRHLNAEHVSSLGRLRYRLDSILKA